MKTTAYHDRILGKDGFLGVDFAATPTSVDPRRLTECINLWRDRDADTGGFLETFPGFRKLFRCDEPILSLFHWTPPRDPARRSYLIVRAGHSLYTVRTEAGEDNGAIPSLLSGTLSDGASCLFPAGDMLGVLDGVRYRLISFDPERERFSISGAFGTYTPLTWENDAPRELRNALSSYAREAWQLSAPDHYASGTPTLLYAVTSESAATCAVTGVVSPIPDLRIPGFTVIDGKSYRVTSIADRAFQNDNTLGSVFIEEGVEKIGRYAFNTCLGLTSVRLPDSLTSVGKGAFAGCTALTSIHVGRALSEVGDYAFYQCSSLSSVTYGQGEDEWAAVTVEDHNDPLTDAAVTFESDGERASRCLWLPLHERASAVTERTLDGVPLPVGRYMLTEDTYAEAGKTYYRNVGGRYESVTVTAGDPVTGYAERYSLWCTPVTETSRGETVVGGLLVGCDDVRALRGKRLEVTVRLSDLSETPPEDYRAGGTTAAIRQAVETATVAACFDGRIFFSGSPALPGKIFYTSREESGRNCPGYVGICNFLSDGSDESPVVAMTSTADLLFVYKGGVTDASVFCHSAEDGDSDRMPRLYPAVAGVPGQGCTGAACVFSDDPVFLSPMGLESTYRRNITAERALCHRSARIDRRLRAEDLTRTKMTEWKEYLLLICPSGHIYMADSRLISAHESADTQYEWLYLEGMGSYTDDVTVYAYATSLPENTVSVRVGEDEIRLSPTPDKIPLGSLEALANAEDGILSATATFTYADGTVGTGTAIYSAEEDESGETRRYLLYPTDEKTGGNFSPVQTACAAGNRLFAGTGDGTVLCCNNDKRSTVTLPDGSSVRVIDRHLYSVCGHRLFSGATTAADTAGIPHLSKHTDPVGTAVRTCSVPGGRVQMRVCTDRDGWRDVGVYTEGDLDFSDFDSYAAVFLNRRFGDAVFREKTRRWAWKQYAFFSNDYQRPFGLGQITYRYTVAGRIKER